MNPKRRFTVKAPTRVDLAGGTLDLWPLYTFVPRALTINAAIDLCAEVTVETTPAEAFSIELQDGAQRHAIPTGFPREWLEKLPASCRFPAWLVANFARRQTDLPPVRFTLSWRTQVPQGSGLGGSSTLAVAFARALSYGLGQFNEQGWQWRLLEWVRDAEAAFLRTPTGSQDYLAALFGNVNAFDFTVGGPEQLGYPETVYEGLKERLLVVFSGEQHHSGMSNWEIYKAAVEGEPETLKGLKRLSDISLEVDKQLRSSVIFWKVLGALLSDEWRARKDSFRVSTPRLDEILQHLNMPGVHGAKVCGAAQGGSLIALIEPAQRASIERRLTEAKLQVLPAKLTRQGVSVQ